MSGYRTVAGSRDGSYHYLEPPPSLEPLGADGRCSECDDTLNPGWQVAWWWIRDEHDHTSTTLVCAACHRGLVRVHAHSGRGGFVAQPGVGR